MNALVTTSNRDILRTFVSKYFELLDFIKSHIGDNVKFRTFYHKNLILRKSNIKAFIRNWYIYLTKQYYAKIMDGDVQYFFSEEVCRKLGERFDTTIMEHMVEIKHKYSETDENVINDILTRVKNLTTLSVLYFNNGC
jgi:hypothetical protein